MYIIVADFQRIEDISLHDIYDEIGVYVLWNGSAQKRPTYIGEGNLLRRFLDHLDKPWARRPLGGLIWIAPSDDFTPRERKLAAQAVEQGLLLVADETNRWPPNNLQEGKESARRRLLSHYGSGETVRINVGGFDPLAPPERPRVKSRKRITVRHDDLEWEGWRAI